MGVGAALSFSAHPRESGDPGVFVRLCELQCRQDTTAKLAKDAKSAGGASEHELEPLASLAVKKTWVPAFAGTSGLILGQRGIQL